MLMAGKSANGCQQRGIIKDDSHKDMYDCSVTREEYRSKWHFTRKELVSSSPSGKDGINWIREEQLRASYCSFIQNLGMELKVWSKLVHMENEERIMCSWFCTVSLRSLIDNSNYVMFCHRFYLRQSHSKNNWQIVATACVFLASKVEETPCLLDKVVVLSYKMMHINNSSGARRIHLKEVFAKQKELILIGERLLLATIGFDFNIQHPYKPLVAALKKFRLENDLMKVAWNFVNDWLRTTLCFQYKPHYIAAGSMYLAAKLNNVELPTQRGSVWWQEFDVMPRQLQEVIQHMMHEIGVKRASIEPCTQGNAIVSSFSVKQDKSSIKQDKSSSNLCACKGETTNTPLSTKESSSPDSVLSQATPSSSSAMSKQIYRDGPKFADHNVSNRPSKEHNTTTNNEEQLEISNGVVINSEVVKSAKGNGSSEISSSTTNKVLALPVGLDKLDREKIRAKLKRRRSERENKKVMLTDDSLEDIWVREIESGIELKKSSKRVESPTIREDERTIT